MDFVQLSVKAPEELREIVMAQLFGLGFSSFQEVDYGFIGSVETDQWDEVAVLDCLHPWQDKGVFFEVQEVAKANWNELWESNFDPVIVDDRCIVKAPFHEVARTYLHEILIVPKMSFGTGHHATTSQMLSMQMGLDHKGKSVLDVGTGTGILLIMALQLGASVAMGTDIDDWCKENSIDNLQLNGYDNIPIQLGAISEITFDRKFEIILANINKNVLESELSNYVDLLIAGGDLLISGFYSEDVPDLVAIGQGLGLDVEKTTEKDNWACIQFRRPGR